LYLAPGDSPIGFRLPLNSLPRVSEVDYPHLVPADPFAERAPLPIPASVIQTFADRGQAAAQSQAAPGHRTGQGIPVAQSVVRAHTSAGTGAGLPVRTALTGEPRNGR